VVTENKPPPEAESEGNTAEEQTQAQRDPKVRKAHCNAISYNKLPLYTTLSQYLIYILLFHQFNGTTSEYNVSSYCL